MAAVRQHGFAAYTSSPRTFKHVINGEVVEIDRERPALTDDAVPTILPDAPSYLTKALPRKRKERSISDCETPSAKRMTPSKNDVASQDFGDEGVGDDAAPAPLIHFNSVETSNSAATVDKENVGKWSGGSSAEEKRKRSNGAGENSTDEAKRSDVPEHQGTRRSSAPQGQSPAAVQEKEPQGDCTPRYNLLD
ncbi:hypothetical protein HPB52_025297 [Rhipicephalus sanguineus]|uniref:Uncharacterized protein n=1 Tax=Rhipicephalus sanguineus TaxID=34632 RepID=A0A9D4YRM6_RHISA|nr:hypothetical protein HPB52_025297 [Rhipicephalus sanguineus]